MDYVKLALLFAAFAIRLLAQEPVLPNPTACIENNGTARASGCPASWIDARKFGAKCDGENEDTAWIQEGLNSTAREHQGLLIPATCLVTHITLPDNSVLKGEISGVSKLLLKPNSGNMTMLTNAAATGNTNISISNLSLDGNRDNNLTNSDSAMNLVHVVGLVVSNVEIAHWSGTPVIFAGLVNPEFIDVNCHHYGYQATVGSGWPNTGCLVGDQSNTTYTVNQNVKVLGGTYDGSDGGVGGMKIGEHWPDGYAQGVEIAGTEVIMGDSSRGSLGIEVWPYAYNVSIHNNYVHGVNAASATSTPNYAISAPNASNNHIFSNRVKWAGRYAIETGGDKIHVHDNDIDTSALVIANQAGDPTHAVTEDVTIENNHIANPACIGSGCIAIEVLNASQYGANATTRRVSISGNSIEFRNNQSGGAILIYCHAGAGQVMDSLRIDDNRMIGTGTSSSTWGIMLNADPCQPTNAQLENNNISGFQQAISLYSPNGVIISGNALANSSQGIYLDGNAKHHTDHVQIFNNRFTNLTTAIQSATAGYVSSWYNKFENVATEYGGTAPRYAIEQTPPAP